MPYSTNFENDVFIRYCHDNNHDGWISELKKQLEPKLQEKLRREGSRIEIWLDHSDLRGNQQLTPELGQAVKSTATLVTILSEAYLASSWCRQERERFLEAVGGLKNANKRLFVVRYEDVPVEKLPRELQETVGYKFCDRDEEIDVVMPISNSGPESQKQAFNKQLYCLRRDLAETIKGLEEKPLQGSTPARVAKNSDAPTVFLAEATPDLHDVRSDVETYLIQAGLNVVPSQPYYYLPDGFEDAIKRHLGDSALFVQLLGQHHFPANDKTPRGFEHWQAELARELGKSRLTWRSPLLKLDSITDESHRNFVNGNDVNAWDLEEFKRAITEQVERLSQQEDIQVGDAASLVLLSAAEVDKELANDLGDLIEELAIEAKKEQLDAAIVSEQASLDLIARERQETGLLVLYGACKKTWTQKRMRECRRVALKLKRKIRGCAVYVTDSYDNDPLDMLPPRFEIIRQGDQDGLQAFISKLAVSGNGA